MTGVGVIGLGRVGRTLVRELWLRGQGGALMAVAEVNPAGRDAAELTADLAYLLAHDPSYGRFPAPVSAQGANLVIAGRAVPVFYGGSPAAVDWAAQGVNVLVEASGDPAAAAEASGLAGGAVAKVLITRSEAAADVTLVKGVNWDAYDPIRHRVVSCSTCTANALAPVLKVIDAAFCVASGAIATIHPALSGDTLLDAPAPQASAGRSGLTVRPVTSEVARTTAQVLPQLKGRLSAMSLRVPTLLVNALIADLVLTRPPAGVDDVVALLEAACAGPLAGIAAIERGFLGRPRVAADFLGDTHSALVDINWMSLNGALLRLLLWHDNERAYCARVADALALVMGRPA